MNTWLSESEFRQSGAEAAGVTINVAFLQEIKDDFGFRKLLNVIYHKFYPKNQTEQFSSREVADLLTDLRDELETYFALEEFYGYFEQAAVDNPCVNQKACKLKSEHEKLYLQLSQVVDRAEQIVYQENGTLTLVHVAKDFEDFCVNLAHHEQAEMNLMMRLHNEDLGVGD